MSKVKLHVHVGSNLVINNKTATCFMPKKLKRCSSSMILAVSRIASAEIPISTLSSILDSSTA